MSAGASERVRPLRIAIVGPVAQSVPPIKSGSIETVTSLLADGLVARGHDVTLFATAASRTTAKLHAIYADGYNENPSLWPWELCELFNLSAALEQPGRFDVIHYQAEYCPLSLAFARISATPVLQTVHYLPGETEVALWSQYPEVPFIAISHEQARALAGLNVVSVIHLAVDATEFSFGGNPGDYLLFLGRFTEGKGVVQAIDVARRAGMRLVLAAAENEYYRDAVAPLVDGREIVYAGEVSGAEKVALIGGARALLYPVQSGEPFGLVVAEAMCCGTPIAALDRGSVREIIDDGVTGRIFGTLDDLVSGLPSVFALDRAAVRERAVSRYGIDRMISAHEDVYRKIAGAGGRTGNA